jgi:hypothetical protein
MVTVGGLGEVCVMAWARLRLRLAAFGKKSKGATDARFISTLNSFGESMTRQPIFWVARVVSGQAETLK